MEQYDRLPELAADLVRREVAVILTTGGPCSSAGRWKTATAAIPIVFAVGTILSERFGIEAQRL